MKGRTSQWVRLEFIYEMKRHIKRIKECLNLKDLAATQVFKLVEETGVPVLKKGLNDRLVDSWLLIKNNLSAIQFFNANNGRGKASNSVLKNEYKKLQNHGEDEDS